MEEQMEQEETMGETGMLVGSVDYVPSFAVSLEVAAQRLADFQKFIQDQMIEDEDYGVIPGTSKPTLLKPGAEKLANIFGFAAQFEEVREVEHWDDPGFFYYSYKCRLLNKRTGQVEAECTASCNSKEDKYRWRGGERKCPECGAAAIIKGKEEYGGGWVCWTKRGGCDAKFTDGDESIKGQKLGRVENPDPYSLVNTLQKMAQKRALIGAVLIATRASGIFTQDLDDFEANGVPVKGEKSVKKSTAKGGKVSGDPMSVLWDWANAQKPPVKEGAVKEALANNGGDAEKALIVLKELSGV